MPIAPSPTTPEATLKMLKAASRAADMANFARTLTEMVWEARRQYRENELFSQGQVEYMLDYTKVEAQLRRLDLETVRDFTIDADKPTERQMFERDIEALNEGIREVMKRWTKGLGRPFRGDLIWETVKRLWKKN